MSALFDGLAFELDGGDTWIAQSSHPLIADSDRQQLNMVFTARQTPLRKRRLTLWFSEFRLYHPVKGERYIASLTSGIYAWLGGSEQDGELDGVTV